MPREGALHEKVVNCLWCVPKMARLGFRLSERERNCVAIYNVGLESSLRPLAVIKGYTNKTQATIRPGWTATGKSFTSCCLWMPFKSSELSGVFSERQKKAQELLSGFIELE